MIGMNPVTEQKVSTIGIVLAYATGVLLFVGLVCMDAILIKATLTQFFR